MESTQTARCARLPANNLHGRRDNHHRTPPPRRALAWKQDKGQADTMDSLSPYSDSTQTVTRRDRYPLDAVSIA